jgi:hypothetical protein
MNSNTTTARADPSPPRHLAASPGGFARNAHNALLAELKSRLLRETLGEEPDEPLARLLRLAAVEAEAQAWLTSYPLLLFPSLFEEKALEARSYVARQHHVRPKSA